MDALLLLVVVLAIVAWMMPLFMISKADHVSQQEKLLWMLLVVFVSWFAWIFFLLLAPVMKGYPLQEPPQKAVPISSPNIEKAVLTALALGMMFAIVSGALIGYVAALAVPESVALPLFQFHLQFGSNFLQFLVVGMPLAIAFWPFAFLLSRVYSGKSAAPYLCLIAPFSAVWLDRFFSAQWQSGWEVMVYWLGIPALIGLMVWVFGYRANLTD